MRWLQLRVTAIISEGHPELWWPEPHHPQFLLQQAGNCCCPKEVFDQCSEGFRWGGTGGITGRFFLGGMIRERVHQENVNFT